MKNKLFSRVLGLLLAVVLMIPSWGAEANAATKNIKDYATISGAENDSLILCSSLDDFKTQIEMGALPVLTTGAWNHYKKCNVTVKENGYLLIRGYGANDSGCYVRTYRDSSLTTKISDYVLDYSKTVFGYFPVEAGTYYFEVNDSVSLYIGFVPFSSACSISAREQKNKSIYVDVKTLEKKTQISVSAVDGIKSSFSCWNNGSWIGSDYDGSVKNDTATILFTESGKYTLMIEVEFNENCHNRFVYQMDTKDLLAESKKMEVPISILAGTNLIIGEANPNSTIYATVNGTDYSAKADENGIYRLKVGKLKKKKSVKMWQVENGKTNAEATFKVVNKY